MSGQIKTKLVPVFFWGLSLAKDFCQSGIDLASKTAGERLHVAGYTSQVYSFESCNMLVSASGERRITSETERELLLGFDKFYTYGSLKVNPESESCLFFRYQFLVRTFSSQVFAWLLERWISSQLLVCAFSNQVLAWLLDKVISSLAVGAASTYVGRSLEAGVACKTWGLLPRFYARCIAGKVLLLGFGKVYTDGSSRTTPSWSPACSLGVCSWNVLYLARWLLGWWTSCSRVSSRDVLSLARCLLGY
jgi:hypothetical protein